MPSNYLQGNMTVPASAYGAMAQAQGHSSTGGQAALTGGTAGSGLTFKNYYDNFKSAIKDIPSSMQEFKESLPGKQTSKPVVYSPVSSYDSGSESGSSSQPQQEDFLDAPWASAYGMSKETAYNEAMTNTEYRRAVKDMQAAGLNPAVIFGAGKGSTSGVPGYISSPSSHGGGGSYSGGSRSYGGSSSKNGYLFSGSAYSVLSALGGIAGAAVTKSAGGYWIGTALAQGAMHAASSFNKLFR